MPAPLSRSTAVAPQESESPGIRARRAGAAAILAALFRKRSAQIGGVIIVLLLATAAFAGLLAPYDPYRLNPLSQLGPPSSSHWLGTDALGRDELSRIIYGTRTTLVIGAISVGIAMVLGVTFGIVAGYYGGWVDLLLMRVIDVMLALPYILLALAIVAILGPGLGNTMIAIGLSNVPGWVRLVRGNVLTIRRHDFVLAAGALGARDARVMFVHILPNTVSSIVVLATLQFATAILAAAALSFVGLGAQPPSPEWGALLVGARDFMFTAPWLVNFPGLAIFLVVLGFNLFGNALRDTLDPTLRMS
jgi:peptide/nickel transport system permease protein